MPICYLLLSLLMSLQLVWAEDTSIAVHSSPVAYSSVPKVTSKVTYRKVRAPKASTRRAVDVLYGPMIVKEGNSFLRTQEWIEVDLTVRTQTTPFKVKFEFYKPFLPEKVLVDEGIDQFIPPYDPGPDDYFEILFYFYFPIASDFTARTALGEWEVKGYVDSGDGFEETTPAYFTINAESSERYRYQNYLSTDRNNVYPHIPSNQTQTFYTSNRTGEVVHTIVYDYYYQDPGIGSKTKWYYTNEQGTDIFLVSSEPSWSNNAIYKQPPYETYKASNSAIPILALIEANLVGNFYVESYIDYLNDPDQNGFVLEQTLPFELIDDVRPTLSIEMPDNQETNESLIAIAGQSDDDIGVVKIKWSGSDQNGEITGDEITDWLASDLELQEGDNTFSFTAEDKAGNVSETQTLTVTKTNEAEDECFQVFVPGSDPIDAFTGGQILKHELLTVNGVLPVTFALKYDSKKAPRWVDKHFSGSLKELANGNVKVYWDALRYNIFNKQADGHYQAAHRACQFDTLTKHDDGTFSLYRQKSQETYYFNVQGQLERITNAQSQSLHLSYNTAGQLLEVQEPITGVALNYSYDNNGLLTEVTDSLGRQVTLVYDELKHLIQLTDAAQHSYRYVYDDHQRIVSGTDGEQRQRFYNTFDEKGRIIAQDDGVTGNQLLHINYVDHQRIITDRQNQVSTYTFDDNYRLLNLQNALGEMTSYTYNSQGLLETKTDANHHITRYSYDERGNVVTVIDPAQQPTTLSYDANNNLIAIENALGKRTELTYTDNRLTAVKDSLGQMTRYLYDNNGQVQTKTNPRGGITTLGYNNGRPTQVTDPEGVIYTLGYDAAGRLVTLTDAAHHTTTITYDGKSRVISVTNPLGHSIHFTYDSRDNVLTFTDANGQVTRRQYDGNGNLTRKINALNQETRYEYDGNDHLIRVIDAKNQVTQLGYDTKGRLISLTNPLGYAQTLEYDAADNLLKRFDALGKNVISLNYDELDNPTRITDALANNTFFDYDQLSRLTQTTDSLEAVTQFHYDDLNRLIASVDALTGVSSQNFDADSNRDNLTDPNNNPTQFDFDLSGRLIQTTVATGNQVKYSYNASNLLTQITNARGQSRQLEYDAADRITRWTDPEGTTSYSYDNNGNILTVTDSQGTITRTYDALNRIVSYTDINGNILRYAYDVVGNLVTLTYPDDKQVHYEYDATDQLVKVTDWAGRITQYQYDANGRLIKTLRPNGTVQTRQYDVKGQLLTQTDLDAQGNALVAYTFSYDAAGNIVQEQITPELSLVLPPSVEMTYTAANRLATFNGQAVQFDADGNLLSAPLNGQMSPLQFDSRNRLMQAGSTSYRYDAENQRIGVNQTQFVVNSQPALSQVLVKESNGIKTFYVYGLGLIGEETNSQYRTYHFDFRGSTVALTDEIGQVTERFQYAPYGELVSGDASQTPFLFNGMYGVMTDESGLYYMRARFYSPEIKRFVNQDILLGNVVEGQTLNRFAYVTGNPVSFVDPFGLEMLPPEYYENTGESFVISPWDAYFLADEVRRKVLADIAQKVNAGLLPREERNSERDAVRHCSTACGLSLYLTRENVELMQDIWEFGGDVISNSSAQDRAMDYHNNWCGMNYSEQLHLHSESECLVACMQGIQDGTLIKRMSSLTDNFWNIFPQYYLNHLLNSILRSKVRRYHDFLIP